MLKLLVADDSPPARQVIRFLLHNSRIGAAVVAEAGNGAEAVRLALEKNPDIIFMDIKMPGGDGLAALQEIRRQGLHAPCIIVTAFDDLSYAQEAIRLGVTDFLLKPIRPEELSRALERAVGELRPLRFPRAEALDMPDYPREIEDRLLGALHVYDLPAVRSLLSDWCRVIASRFSPAETRVLAQQLLALAAREICPGERMEPKSLALKFGRMLGEEQNATTIRLLLEQAFIELITQVAGQKGPRNHQIVTEAIAFLRQNFARPVHLKDVAAAIHVSSYYLSHLFSKVTGGTLVEYLKQIRIEEAKRLLQTTDLSVAEVGARVGFRNIDHFSKIFKLETGAPPSSFRNHP